MQTTKSPQAGERTQYGIFHTFESRPGFYRQINADGTVSEEHMAGPYWNRHEVRVHEDEDAARKAMFDQLDIADPQRFEKDSKFAMRLFLVTIHGRTEEFWQYSKTLAELAISLENCAGINVRAIEQIPSDTVMTGVRNIESLQEELFAIRK